MTIEQCQDILSANEFIFIGTCNCHGRFNLKYKKNHWLIYLSPKHNQFKAKRYGTTVKNYSTLDGFKTYIETIFGGK